MTYYLQDNPNPNTGQFGWPRKKVSGVIGVHTTESGVDFDGDDWGAENTARFIGNRSDYGSYHAMGDADSRIKLVHPSFAAWADTTNNAHAMSVSGAMNAARWRDLTQERAAAIVRNMGIAAAELVQDAIAAGLLSTPTPARRITPAEAVSGSRAGFYGHGETNPGTRYDPGQNFDWDLFLTTYAAAIGGGIKPQGTNTPKEWDEMASKDEIKDAIREVTKEGYGIVDSVWYRPVHGWNGAVSAESRLAGTDQAVSDIRAQLGGLQELVKQLSVKQGVTIDYAAIAKAVNDEEAKRMQK